MQYACLAAGDNPPEYSAWRRMALEGPQPDPFSCLPEWQLAFHDALDGSRPLLFVSTGESMLALAETTYADGQVFLQPIEAAWCFGCPLLGRNPVPLLLDTAERIGAEKNGAPVRFVISGLDPKGTLARRLVRDLGDIYGIYLHEAGRVCAASLQGGVDGWLSRRSANLRAKLKKARRCAFERGVRFERVNPASVPEAHACYERMLAIESRSWKGLDGCGMTNDSVRPFYDALIARTASRRDARVIFARCDGRDIGFIFGTMADRIYRGQQFSFDNDWRAFSIGNIMQYETVAWLCEEGALRYDMGTITGDRMQYKSHWTELDFAFQTWVFVKNAY